MLDLLPSSVSLVSFKNKHISGDLVTGHPALHFSLLHSMCADRFKMCQGWEGGGVGAEVLSCFHCEPTFSSKAPHAFTHLAHSPPSCSPQTRSLAARPLYHPISRTYLFSHALKQSMRVCKTNSVLIISASTTWQGFWPGLHLVSCGLIYSPPHGKGSTLVRIGHSVEYGWKGAAAGVKRLGLEFCPTPWPGGRIAHPPRVLICLFLTPWARTSVS